MRVGALMEIPTFHNRAAAGAGWLVAALGNNSHTPVSDGRSRGCVTSRPLGWMFYFTHIPPHQTLCPSRVSVLQNLRGSQTQLPWDYKPGRARTSKASAGGGQGGALRVNTIFSNE